MAPWAMATAGPSFSPAEQAALLRYLEVMAVAGAAGRRPAARDATPSERWKQFEPASAAHSLPASVAGFISNFGWRRVGAGEATVPPAIAAAAASLHQPLTGDELTGALAAGAFWLEPGDQTAFEDDAALSAIESLVGLVNGFVQTLPRRRLPNEHPDAHNRRFRAYQRRRFGYEATVRTPQALVRRLPPAAHELIDSYEDHLLFESVESARALAATTAIALGRPVDPTMARQVEIALAVAMTWRRLSEFPNTPSGHVLLGEPSTSDARRWQLAATVVGDALRYLESPRPPASDPRAVQTAASAPVAGIVLDARALQSLAELDEYVSLLAAWLRTEGGLSTPVAIRLKKFDAAMRGGECRDPAGDVIAALPDAAMEVVTAFGAALAVGESGDEIAAELAVVLGDRNLVKRYARTLRTASHWFTGQMSPLERTRAPVVPEPSIAPHDLPFAPAGAAGGQSPTSKWRRPGR